MVKIGANLKSLFNNSSVLITGGTGSFGEKAVHYILKKLNPKKLTKEDITQINK